LVAQVRRADANLIAVIQNRMKDSRAVDPRSVSALQIFDDVAVRPAKNAGVIRGDAEVVELDAVVAVTADAVLHLDERNDRSRRVAAHDQQLCKGFAYNIFI